MYCNYGSDYILVNMIDYYYFLLNVIHQYIPARRKERPHFVVLLSNHVGCLLCIDN